MEVCSVKIDTMLCFSLQNAWFENTHFTQVGEREGLDDLSGIFEKGFQPLLK